MIRINLLPTRELKKRAKIQRQIVLSGVLVLLVIGGVVGVWLLQNQEIARLRQERQVLQADLDRLKKIVEEVNSFKEKQRILETKLQVIDKLKANQQGPVHFLDEVSRNLPTQIWLTRIESADDFTIQGNAFDNLSIAEYMKNLEKSGYFTNVELIQVAQREIEGVKVSEFLLKAKGTARPKSQIAAKE